MYKMMLLNIAFEVILAVGNFQSFSLMITKRLTAQFFTRVSTTMTAGPRTPSRRHASHIYVKDMKNNHKTLLAVSFLFISR